MKIAVCIKRVPDTETRVKPAADGKGLDEGGVKFILNPYDEFAVEEGLRRGDVTVLSLGPAAAQETIRTALAMGADRGVLLQTDRIPADGFETAKAIAAELKDGGWDLILFGKMAIDDYNHQVGPVVAAKPQRYHPYRWSRRTSGSPPYNAWNIAFPTKEADGVRETAVIRRL